MLKQFLSTKTYSRVYILSLFIIGAGISAMLMILNQQFPVTVSLASMLSPTGARFVIGGVRIKHWMTGLFLAFLGMGMVLKDSKSAFLKELGIVFIGAGAIQFIDELIDWDF